MVLSHFMEGETDWSVESEFKPRSDWHQESFFIIACAVSRNVGSSVPTDERNELKGRVQYFL